MATQSSLDENTPLKRAMRLLDMQIKRHENEIEKLRFIRRALLEPEYDDRYPNGKKP